MMKPIYEFQTIQVELTNACIHSCSNCTRFCGHHKKPFFMEWETFKNAVDTLEKWPRSIGIMGGEPTLHPEFERFVNYASEKHPMPFDIGGGHKPIASLSKYIYDSNSIKTGALSKFRGLGLWSSVCNNYYEHYETIQDKFIYQCINDHTASSRHQAWLMTRKEFAIGDDEWIELRDNCWWQRLLGSPSITPKGAFFCEVAAAMDMLFDGPGGWPVEEGWWKRGPEDFGDQLKWCEYCSGAFLSFDRDANESIDDVSPYMYEKLKEVQSPKLKKEGAIRIHPVGENCDIEIKPRKNMLLYQPDHELRFTNKNKSLYPKKTFAVTFIQTQSEIDENLLKTHNDLFDEFRIYTENQSVYEQLKDGHFVELYTEISPCNQLAKLIKSHGDWIAIIQPKTSLDSNLKNLINNTIFNPGTYHIFEETGMVFFNVISHALKHTGFAKVAALKNLDDLHTLWAKEKIAVLKSGFEKSDNPDIAEWNDNLLKGGIMNWNGLRGVMNNIEVNRVITPFIENIVTSEDFIETKLCKLDEVPIGSVSKETICDKLKTVVHNELGKAYKQNTLSEIKKRLLSNPFSYCANYALAMLSTGDEKVLYLTKCILNGKNHCDLGVATLKMHVDSYERSMPKYRTQEMGIIEEILLLSDVPQSLVILGNRYAGKSVEMILSKAGQKPVAFGDEERQGYGFDGIPTLNFEEMLNQYPDKKYIMTMLFEEEDYFHLSLERRGYKKEYHKLHPLALLELYMTPATAAMGISEKVYNQIKELKRDRTHSSELLVNSLVGILESIK